MDGEGFGAVYVIRTPAELDGFVLQPSGG